MTIGKEKSKIMDETEKDFSKIAIEFRKVVRKKASSVKIMVKAMLNKELSHVNENVARLIHGKA
ncbi:MAG TPA: hypothetical protein HPP94_16525 [Desulfuromonadales bacterium]|nr:hypothetical protein [Desulfuromonadales bacterium]